jgi:hypothetical protein
MEKKIKLNKAAIACLPAIMTLPTPQPEKWLMDAICLKLETRNKLAATNDEDEQKQILQAATEKLEELKKSAYLELLRCEAEHDAAYDALRAAQPELQTIEFRINLVTNEATVEGPRNGKIEPEEDVLPSDDALDTTKKMAEDWLERARRH